MITIICGPTSIKPLFADHRFISSSLQEDTKMSHSSSVSKVSVDGWTTESWK